MPWGFPISPSFLGLPATYRLLITPAGDTPESAAIAKQNFRNLLILDLTVYTELSPVCYAGKHLIV